MEILQRCPLFSGFSAEEIAALLGGSGCAVQKLKKGAQVPGRHLGLLLKGRLRILGRSADSRRIELNHILPGAAFGAASLFLEHTELSSILAEAQSEVLLMGAEQVWKLLDASPKFRKNYISFLCGRIAFLNHKIQNLSGSSAESRLLSYLRWEQKEGALKVRSFQALAGMLGISRSSLYRAMDVLSAQGQIARQGSSIILKDSAARQRGASNKI